LDAVNLKIRRHWISKESLLCAIGITQDGKKELLGFLLGGRESTKSWENLLLLLMNRGLSAERLKLMVVDGNAGFLSALNSLFPSVPVQCCIVHKIRNVVGKCPCSLRSIIPAEFKRYSMQPVKSMHGNYLTSLRNGGILNYHIFLNVLKKI